MHTNNDHFVSLHIYSILVILLPFWVLVTIFFSILFQSCLRNYNQNSIKLENLSNWMITQGICSNWMITQGICLLHCVQFQYTSINVFCLKLFVRFFLLESKQIMDAIVCWVWFGLWCLMPLSTIFQLYRWRKPEYPKKTTDLSQIIDKL